MAPKKKGNKKAQDDWEADLGETVPPTNAAATESNAGGDLAANGDEEASGGGGLMAMLRKNKEKRKKKGLADDEQAEDADAPGSEPAEDLSNRAPPETVLDDEFALPEKKGKAGKGKPAPKKEEPEDGNVGESGKILTKAEKEKLKKEREKQRKKEQVRATCHMTTYSDARKPRQRWSSYSYLRTKPSLLGCQEEDKCPRQRHGAGQYRSRSSRGPDSRGCANTCYRDRREEEEASSTSRNHSEAARRTEEAARGRGTPRGGS